MQSEFAASAHWRGEFDESRFQKWAVELRAQLQAPKVSLGLVFISPKLFPNVEQILEILRVDAQVPLLAGCSSNSLIAGAHEFEDDAGLVVSLYQLPGAELKGVHFTQADLEQASDASYWHHKTGISPQQTNGWLAFADPFNMDCEVWLNSWNEAYSHLPILGGLASGDYTTQQTQVYLNGEVYEEGGVAISIGGDVKPVAVISQGCTPIGDTWTLTKVERNLIQEIGNRPAFEVLAETFGTLSQDEQQASRGNLFIGLVTNEYLEEFHRGDFLVRNLIGVDPQSGVIAVGALPRLGQTVQFQRRDAAAATEDMEALLARAKKQLAGATIYGGCLCSCNGRGQGLFGEPDHDAKMIQEMLGPVGMVGFFCNGEIGPVGDKNFLHGYTASLTLFVKKS